MHVEVPRFAHQRGRRHAGLDHTLQIGIMFGQTVLPARAAKSGDFRLKLELLDPLEKLDVFAVAARNATFNVMDTQLIQLPCDLQLVVR